MIRTAVVVFLVFACVATLRASELAQRIDAILPVVPEGSPGCAVAVLHHGTPVYERAWGLADVELGVPISENTVFLAGSIAKQFTAAAILLLAGDQRLRLDDGIRKYLPELPEYASRITIRHLLAHSSGLKDDMELMKVAGLRTWDDAIREADVLSIVSRQRSTNFTPGTEFLYSDTGYDLLAIIVRRASGKSLAAFASERIFEPLGMTRTRFRDDHRQLIAGRASGYVFEDGQLRRAVPRTSQVGAANLFTTTSDLLRWVANFWKPVVGGSSLISALSADTSLATGSTTGYGAGLELKTYRGHRVIEHDGAQAGYVGDVLLMPDDALAIVYLCNVRQNPRTLPRKIADVFLGAPVAAMSNADAQPGASLTTSDIELIRGVFWSDRDGAYNIIEVRDGRVLATDSDGDAFELVKRGAGTFGVKGQGAQVAFIFRGDTLERKIGRKTHIFRRVGAPHLTKASLPAYAGKYWNAETSATWEVAVRDGKLILRRWRFDDEELRPIFVDGFESEQWMLHFTRDGNGRVHGIDVLNARLRSTRFERIQ